VGTRWALPTPIGGYLICDRDCVYGHAYVTAAAIRLSPEANSALVSPLPILASPFRYNGSSCGGSQDPGGSLGPSINSCQVLTITVVDNLLHFHVRGDYRPSFKLVA